MGNKTSTIDQKSIDVHNETTAKSRMKILLFGSNIGKSHWFNGGTDHKTIFNVTFKIESFNIGPKLPEIKTVIYDTPRNIIFFNDTLKYMSYANIPRADGMIFTYNIHCMDSLYHLEECIDKIKETITKRTPCLLLGIQETNDTNIIGKNYVDDAQTFCIKHNLYHLEIDITQNINTKEPYIYLLTKILKQKQTILSRFNNDKYVENNNKQKHIEYKINKNDFLMPYTYRQFSQNYNNNNDNDNEHYNSDPNDDEDEKNVQNTETLGIEFEPNLSNNEYKISEINEINEINEYDNCQLEFERFFKLSMGNQRSNKYLNKFKRKQYNDIRFIDPEIFDYDWFKINEINMNLLDQKLFKKEIKKYKNDSIKFENMLKEINMCEKYHKSFVNVGIATQWSFHYHINSIKNIQDIIGNNTYDAIIIWSKYNNINQNNNHDNHNNNINQNQYQYQIEGINKKQTNNAIETVTVNGLKWIEKCPDVGNSSDSEEIYNDPN